MEMIAGVQVQGLFKLPEPDHAPLAGSAEEIKRFSELQFQLAHQFRHAFPDKLAPKTIVIVPSLTLDQEILSKVSGILHYEERMLCMMMLLRMPRTQVIYVTSMPLDPVVVDYYLHLLPGITGYHARQRLTLLSCFDAAPVSLTQKVLSRPRLMQRIRQQVIPGSAAHLVCFNVTPLERTLSVRLDLPLYGCDPDLFSLGNKSNGRKLFRACGLQVPDGVEDLRNLNDLVNALANLKQKYPGLQKAVVKMNEGFSGEGNAVYRYSSHAEDNEPDRLKEELPNRLEIVASDLSFEAFLHKFESMGGIAEIFVEGKKKQSPSVQWRIDPIGGCDVISTHDQLLGGDDQQVFLGAHFPADAAYAVEVAAITRPLAEALRNKGVIGRFGIDFISTEDEPGQWQHYAIEINLRKGGTTHPYLMLQFLTDGTYDAQQGRYIIPTGQQRYYFSTDNLYDIRFKGLTPYDLIEIAIDNALMYDGATQEGVMFHMIGALSQYGKIGVVCIGETAERAMNFFNQTREVLMQACGHCEP
jgi:hypothetical protein